MSSVLPKDWGSVLVLLAPGLLLRPFHPVSASSLVNPSQSPCQVLLFTAMYSARLNLWGREPPRKTGTVKKILVHVL